VVKYIIFFFIISGHSLLVFTWLDLSSNKLWHSNSVELDTVYRIQVSATSTNGREGEKSPIIEVKTSPLGKCKQYVGGVVK
jgi:hypothetical protein